MVQEQRARTRGCGNRSDHHHEILWRTLWKTGPSRDRKPGPIQVDYDLMHPVMLEAFAMMTSTDFQLNPLPDWVVVAPAPPAAPPAPPGTPPPAAPPAVAEPM